MNNDRTTSAIPARVAPPNKDLDRQLSLATWSGAIAAFMSFLATIGLVYLASRQETATYESVLLGQQVVTFGQYIKDMFLERDYAFEIITSDPGSTKHLIENIGSFSLLQANLVASTASLAALSPDGIVGDLAYIEQLLSDIYITAKQTNTNDAQAINSLIKKGSDWLAMVQPVSDEIQGCFRNVLGTGHPLTRDTVTSCNLSGRKVGARKLP